MQPRYRLLHGMRAQKMAALASSEGGFSGSLTSNGHLLDTRHAQLEGRWVPTSLNQLELELDTADSKLQKNNSSKHLNV